MTYPQQYPPAPGYPPPGYPPQAPPPVLYPPQPPAQPQGYYPQAPQGYGAPPVAGPQQPPPTQLARGSLKSFANQPNGAFGPALKFDVQGRWYVMRVARALNDGDSRQASDPKTRQPQWNQDGSPKEQLMIPVIIKPGISQAHPTGAATFYVQSKNQREELNRALAEAGLADLTEVRGGDVIFAMLTGERSSGMGNPAKLYQMTYTRAENVDTTWGAEAPPMAPSEVAAQPAQAPPPPPAAPTAPQYAQPQYVPQGQAPAPYQPQPGMPGWSPPVQQPPTPQPAQAPPPAPPGVPQPPAAPPVQQPAPQAPSAPPAAAGAPEPTPEMQARMQQLANAAMGVQAQPTG